MACDYELAIMEYLDGELCEVREEELKEHLNICRSCRDFMSAMESQNEMFSAVPLLSPEAAFTKKVMRGVYMEKSRNRTMAFAACLASLAIAILLICLALPQMLQSITPSISALAKGIAESMAYLNSIIDAILNVLAYGFMVSVELQHMAVITGKIIEQLIQFYSWEIMSSIGMVVIGLVLLIRLLNSEKAMGTD